jgi:hypothetical protein
VRTTFFVVAGPISAYTQHEPFSFAAPLDATEESRRFFAGLNADRRFELAYHGYNHGTPGKRTEEFVQEWRGFSTPEKAAAQTHLGLEIFQRAVGSIPRGGKYGGWDYNEFADDIVGSVGFSWWCRDWMPRDVTGGVSDDYYDPQTFGREGQVVALPSTVHGHFWDTRQVDLLLVKRQIISIEEHIAAIRPDGRIQTPNIIDDIDELRRLYRLLRSKNVWHANCSDIASYVEARDRSLVYDVTREGFSIRYDGPQERPALTLSIDCSAICTPDKPRIVVSAPDGRALAPNSYRMDVDRFRHLVTIPVMSGRFHVQPTRA